MSYKANPKIHQLFPNHTEKLMTVPVDDNELERLLGDRMLVVTVDTLGFDALD